MAGKKPKDDRPDWLKAAAYEMMFIKEALNKALEAVKMSENRIKYALEEADNLAQNIDKNTLSSRYKKHIKEFNKRKR